MFTFLTPLFLWAAVAAMIPLVLHLIQSRRSVRVPFSTIRFLKLADSHSSRRIKMEHFILWLLRTLLILLLVMAFAMPILRTTGLASFLSRANRDVAIVLDTSSSMHYVMGRETVWDQAIEDAVSVIEGLADQDRVCIFLAGREVTPLIEQLSGDRESAVRRLKQLRPGFTGSRIEPALIAANDALKEEPRRREREIHIISDNQALPWERFEQWKTDLLAEHTTLLVSLLGVPNPENTAPLTVTIDPPIIMADRPVSVNVRLTGSGTAHDTIITLIVDEKEIGRRAISRSGNGVSDATFTIPPLGPGVHAARVETPMDNMPPDDAFYFLLRTRDQLPTLCVGSEEATLFLRLAFEANSGAGSGIAVKRIAPDALVDESLDDYACLFLCNALPLPGQEVMQVERYVRSGGLLVIWPGSTARPADYAAWRCLPGLPTAISDVPIAARTRILRWRQPQHPLLSALRQGVGTPVVAIRRQLSWDELADDTETLVSAGAEDAFLLARPFGQGRVLCLSISADRSWSDFPLSPYYLPLAHQIVQFAAGMGRFSHYHWITDSLALTDPLPEATLDSALRDPAGAPLSLRSAILDGVTALQAEDLDLPGIYTLSTPAQPTPQPALAINMPRQESDLTPIDPADVRARLAVDDVQVATDPATLLRLIEEHRIGKTFGEALLWLALVVALAEVVYGNALARGVPKLSEALHIDATGKVKG